MSRHLLDQALSPDRYIVIEVDQATELDNLVSSG